MSPAAVRPSTSIAQLGNPPPPEVDSFFPRTISADASHHAEDAPKASLVQSSTLRRPIAIRAKGMQVLFTWLQGLVYLASQEYLLFSSDADHIVGSVAFREATLAAFLQKSLSSAERFPLEQKGLSSRNSTVYLGRPSPMDPFF